MQKTEHKNEGTSNVRLDGWDVQDLADEATNMPSDEITRQVLRGDETKGAADERDVAGSVNSNETPQGRKETKKTDKA